ncbi:hypothetical protein HZA33_03955 [Candidatus Pacearchaeota archaeon]|nr:hypothetical protein [Candidatus Pacearchaeota archaeon]
MSEISQGKEAEEFVDIIKSAKKEMRSMLASVFQYNYGKCKDRKEKDHLKNILEAMSVIDRQYFIPPKMKIFSYDDNALEVGYGQTISQPCTVARMLLLSELEKGLIILEVGAGSGWNSALIAYIAKPGKVITTDRIKGLAEQTKKNVNALERAIHEKFLNLSIVAEDAVNEKSSIWQQKYDRIIITAGIKTMNTEKKIEKMAESLLRNKGILLCPYDYGPMLIFKKEQGEIKKSQTKENYVFVPILEGVE